MILRGPELEQMERRYRAAFVNSLSGFKAANLVIGEVTLVDVPEEAVGEDGGIDISAAGTVTISGLDSYYRAHRVGKMPYAKPGNTA